MKMAVTWARSRLGAISCSRVGGNACGKDSAKVAAASRTMADKGPGAKGVNTAKGVMARPPMTAVRISPSRKPLATSQVESQPPA